MPEIDLVIAEHMSSGKPIPVVPIGGENPALYVVVVNGEVYKQIGSRRKSDFYFRFRKCSPVAALPGGTAQMFEAEASEGEVFWAHVVNGKYQPFEAGTVLHAWPQSKYKLSRDFILFSEVIEGVTVRFSQASEKDLHSRCAIAYARQEVGLICDKWAAMSERLFSKFADETVFTPGDDTRYANYVLKQVARSPASISGHKFNIELIEWEFPLDPGKRWTSVCLIPDTKGTIHKKLASLMMPYHEFASTYNAACLVVNTLVPSDKIVTDILVKSAWVI